MNRALILTIAACATVLAGCGHGQTVVTGADGSKAVINGNQMEITGPHGEKSTITSNGNNSEVVVKSKDGTSSYSQQGNTAKFNDDKGNSMETGVSVTEQDLGEPFYPGSTEAPGSVKATSNGTKSTVISMRTTTDDPDKVLAFYTDKIGTPKNSNTMATLIMAGWDKDGKEVTLMVDKSASPAKITLSVSTGK